MIKRVSTCCMAAVLVTSLTCPEALAAETGFQVVAGAALEAAVPRDFYLEGNAIPVEKRNAILLRAASGKRLLVALLDTSGYSSQVQTKYAGMLITEASINVCGITLRVGSYGIGLRKPERGTLGKAELTAYDQSGERLLACVVVEDTALDRPVPLQVMLKTRSSVRVYLGRYWFNVQLISHVGVAE